MALSKDDIKTTYPLAVYNYKVEIGSDTVAFSEFWDSTSAMKPPLTKKARLKAAAPVRG